MGRAYLLLQGRGWAMGERKTVLVVEDHPPLRSAIRALLEQMGLSAVEASDGESALAALRELQPELICLDLVLPDTSGYDLCEQIRAERGATPILAMSERSYPADRAQAAESGADDFLAKPFEESELRRRIEELLEARAIALAS